MKPFLNLGIVFVVAVFLQVFVAPSQVVVEEDSNSTKMRKVLLEAKNRWKNRETDSAILAIKTALEKMDKGNIKPDSIYWRARLQMGAYYMNKGMYIEALHENQGTLEVIKRKGGWNQSQLAEIYRALSGAHRCLGHFAEAESCIMTALRVSESTSEFKSRQFLYYPKLLGVIYHATLRYAQAESVFQQALTVCKEEVSDTSRIYAGLANSLGELYLDQGKYEEAMDLFKSGLEIRKKLEPPGKHQSMSESLNNLGKIYLRRGKYTDAERSFLRAEQIREDWFWPDHPWTIYPLNNLAYLYALQGKYLKAELYARRALEIVEGMYGSDHWQVAWSQRILGDIYRYQGEHVKADSCYQLSLKTIRKTFSSEHPEVITRHEKLALLYGSTGEYAKSLTHFRELLKGRQYFIDNVFSYASEVQKFKYIERYPLINHALFSLAIIYNTDEAKRSALEMTLRGKAAVIDALSADKKAAYSSYDEKVIRKYERLSEVCGEIATLILSVAEYPDPEIYRDRLRTLSITKDSLETELSKDCSEFKEELITRRFTVDDVANTLPPGSVLCEYIRYEPLDYKKIGNDKEKSGPARYLVFTLDHSGTITLNDLGDAGEIDSLITLARKRIYKAREEVHSPLVVESEEKLTEITGKLYEIIIAPLESYLNDKTDIFISPDGQLNLLPFEILPCPDGQYLIEKHNISYLSSGKDLIRFQKRQSTSNWALIMADPDFDLSQGDLAEHERKTSSKPSSFFVPTEYLRALNECLGESFSPLHYSRQEADSIAKTLSSAGLRVKSYLGADALESVLKEIAAPPRVLHIATHGFFCTYPDYTESHIRKNPLLRSGLALACANRVMAGERQFDRQAEDGRLTGLEASGLNLVGTEVVTLSACETGLGEVRSGEGVFGLRRAFQRAGAQTVIMSLWKVPDKETCDLMTGFYSNWTAGRTKKEAFRKAVLEVLRTCRKEYEAAHPLLWGGFVVLGDAN